MILAWASPFNDVPQRFRACQLAEFTYVEPSCLKWVARRYENGLFSMTLY